MMEVAQGPAMPDQQFKLGPASQLYGCYHPAHPDRALRHALLICQPIAHEYERCHRACRQLAILASGSGISTLRFDYFGTGDSDSDVGQATVERWVDDVVVAAAVVRERSGADQLTLVGVRHGALLAARAAQRIGPLRAFIGWGPIFDSAAVIDEWRRAQAHHDSTHGTYSRPDGTEESTKDQVLGFPIDRPMQAALEGGAFDTSWRGGCDAIRLLCTTDDPKARAFADRISVDGINVDVMTDAASTWADEQHTAVVPRALLVSMIDWVKAL